MNGRKAIVGLAVLAAAATAYPAAASPIKWIGVQLGAHRFGRLSAPTAVVAQAGPRAVGFDVPAPGKCGCGDGPRGPSHFDVGRDGTVWLLDGLRHRFLVWRAGDATRPARVVPVARNVGIEDFVVAPDGGAYAYANDLGTGQGGLLALSPSGRVRWRAPATRRLSQLLSSPLLRVAGDGTLWVFGVGSPPRWRPLTTRAGRPLPAAEQARRSTPTQPLAPGLRLLTSQPTEHEVHYALVDSGGRVVRAWRVRSATSLGVLRAAAELVGDDLLVPLDVSRQAGKRFLWEHLVVRLTPQGRATEVTLPARAVVGGDDAARPLRIAPDGSVYQLRSRPQTGVAVVRYAAPAA